MAADRAKADKINATTIPKKKVDTINQQQIAPPTSTPSQRKTGVMSDIIHSVDMYIAAFHNKRFDARTISLHSPLNWGLDAAVTSVEIYSHVVREAVLGFTLRLVGSQACTISLS